MSSGETGNSPTVDSSGDLTGAGIGGDGVTTTGSRGRMLPLDSFRGIIMVLMALDHASYFIGKVHRAEFWGIQLPQYDNVPWFLTRWITHLCAPGFFFAMGAGIALFIGARRKSGWTNDRIISTMVKRGLFLIILQLFVENPAWVLGSFSRALHNQTVPGSGEMVLLHFGVLYALGASMIILALLSRFSPKVIAAVSVAAIMIPQWTTPGAEGLMKHYSPVHLLFLLPGRSGIWQVFYPVVPWLGIAGLGFLFGRLISSTGQKAFRYTLYYGILLLVLFTAVRGIGGFGNFHSPGRGVISFLNVTKYPPSLSFIFMTLGIDLVFLYALYRIERPGKAMTSGPGFFVTFGQTALFFYIIHLYMYGVVGLVFPRGTSLITIYTIWVLGIVLLFPICSWYRRFKRKKPPESMWRYI